MEIGMRLIVAKDYNEMSKIAADIMAENIKNDPEIVLGLATGGTPVGLYKELIDMYKKGDLDFSRVTSINLDEYIGLSGEHNQSYRYFMNENLFNHVNIDKKNTFVPNGLANDPEKECALYDERVEEMDGIDLQLLGLGGNGHIGFNEPNDVLNIGTHVTNLKEETIQANARFFDSIEEVPCRAITMGLGGIMKAKKIIVVASGESKADAVAKLMSGNVTTEIPASMLQMHSDVVVIVDEAAAKYVK